MGRLGFSTSSVGLSCLLAGSVRIRTRLSPQSRSPAKYGRIATRVHGSATAEQLSDATWPSGVGRAPSQALLGTLLFYFPSPAFEALRLRTSKKRSSKIRPGSGPGGRHPERWMVTHSIHHPTVQYISDLRCLHLIRNRHPSPSRHSCRLVW